MQQLREAFPWDQAPRYLLRDRDAIYGSEFAAITKGMGVEEVVTAPRAPWQNPFVERLAGSIRRECLDHIIMPGHYQLTAEEGQSELQVISGGKVTATVPCRWTHLTNKAADSEVQTNNSQVIRCSSLGAQRRFSSISKLKYRSRLRRQGRVSARPSSPRCLRTA